MLTIFSLVVLFFSIVLHEIAHGSVALHLGDATAKLAGRLTPNPLKHIDLFGTIILPIILLIFTGGHGPIIGWAKPVPVNPFNFKDRKWGSLKVSAAGPAMNFLVGAIFAMAIRFLYLPEQVLIFFSIIVLYNFAWGIFNLLPFPPFDGSYVVFSFLPKSFDTLKIFLYQYHLFIIIFFIIFGGIDFVFRAARILLTLLTGYSLM